MNESSIPARCPRYGYILDDTEPTVPKCRGCGKPITQEHVTDWNGYCDDCIETGRNLDEPINPT